LLVSLASSEIRVKTLTVSGEPDISQIDEATRVAMTEGCDVIIGIGGGSAMDTAKATAAMLANGGKVLDYLEVIGHGRPLTRPSIPWIAVPTTAGTGAEVTRNAVIGSQEHGVKASLRSPLMLARLAVVDADLTYGAPSSVISSAGLDALTQLIEPFLSVRANPVSDGLCREGIRRSARSLRLAVESNDDPEVREDLALASLLSGLALANSGLGAVHGFAGVIGGMFQAPHGAVCARLLPFTMRMNYHAIQSRMPDTVLLGRFDEIAQMLTGDSHASAVDGIDWIEDTCDYFEIPPLSTYGFSHADLQEVFERSSQASSMKANPIQLTQAEMVEILERSL
jgi:alcohol dehydrogenase class IV